MNSGDFDTQETTPVTNEGALAKYITKRVRTKDPVNQIRVFVDMFKTSGNEINVYVCIVNSKIIYKQNGNDSRK